MSGSGAAPSRAAFVARFGGIYEHSPWVAERVWDAGRATDAPRALAAAMAEVVEAAGRDFQMALLRAHPDLAGRLAVGGGLTDASASEQAGAGLDQCNPDEFEAFQALNAAYTEKFGHPFIVAVRGLDRASILERFRARIDNDPEAEFREALFQVHRIAALRLGAIE